MGDLDAIATQGWLSEADDDLETIAMLGWMWTAEAGGGMLFDDWGMEGGANMPQLAGGLNA